MEVWTKAERPMSRGMDRLLKCRSLGTKPPETRLRYAFGKTPPSH